jgi:hypothetical protein
MRSLDNRVRCGQILRSPLSVGTERAGITLSWGLGGAQCHPNRRTSNVELRRHLLPTARRVATAIGCWLPAYSRRPCRLNRVQQARDFRHHLRKVLKLGSIGAQSFGGSHRITPVKLHSAFNLRNPLPSHPTWCSVRTEIAERTSPQRVGPEHTSVRCLLAGCEAIDGNDGCYCGERL